MAQMGAEGIGEVATKVLAALKKLRAVGAEHAVPQERVARLCAMTTRMLQQATLWLNAHGVAVLSSCVKPFGIFLARTVGEVDDYIDQLHSRLIGNALREKHLRGIRRLWIAGQRVEPDGQRRLFA